MSIRRHPFRALLGAGLATTTAAALTLAGT